MTRRLCLLCLFIAVAGCASKDQPAALAHHDSLLAVPATQDTHSHPVALDNGLIVDSSRVVTPDQARTLSRFSPKQILGIYQAYRPLRRPDIPESRLDSFVHVQHISVEELHAILEQGDRLGWSPPAK